MWAWQKGPRCPRRWPKPLPATCWLPNRASTVLQGCEWSGVAVHPKSSLGHATLALLISSLVNPNSAPEKAVTESMRTSKQVTGPQFPAEPSLSSAPWAQACEHGEGRGGRLQGQLCGHHRDSLLRFCFVNCCRVVNEAVAARAAVHPSVCRSGAAAVPLPAVAREEPEP